MILWTERHWNKPLSLITNGRWVSLGVRKSRNSVVTCWPSKRKFISHTTLERKPQRNCCFQTVVTVYSKRQRKFMSFSSIIYTFFKVSPLILGRLFWLLLGQHLRNPRKSGGRCSHTSGLETGKMAGTLSSWNLTVTEKQKVHCEDRLETIWRRFS